MKKLFIIIFILIINSYSFSKKIILKTEMYKGFPPIFYEENNSIKGYGLDVIKEINSRTEMFQITHSDSLIPLNRVKRNLETGEIDLVIFLAKNAEREKIYTYVETPWYELNTSLYTFATNYNGLEDLQKVNKTERVLGILGSNSAKTAKNKGFIVDTSTDFELVFAKFLTGRWKYFVHISVLADSFLETHDYDAQIKESVILQKNSHHTVLRKNISNEIKDEFNRIIKEIKADGTITALLKKYY